MRSNGGLTMGPVGATGSATGAPVYTRNAMRRDRPVRRGRGTAASRAWFTAATAALVLTAEERPFAAAETPARELGGDQKQGNAESASKHGMSPRCPGPMSRVSRIRAICRDGILPVGSIPRAGTDATRGGDFDQRGAASHTACARGVRCAALSRRGRSSAAVRVENADRCREPWKATKAHGTN